MHFLFVYSVFSFAKPRPLLFPNNFNMAKIPEFTVISFVLFIFIYHFLKNSVRLHIRIRRCGEIAAYIILYFQERLKEYPWQMMSLYLSKC